METPNKYGLSKDQLNKIEDFMKIVNNKTCLYEYLMSAYQGIRLGSLSAGEYIKDVYDDDFYFRKAQVEYEEYLRFNKN